MNRDKRIRVLFITKWFMNRRDPQIGVFIRKHASAAALFCDVSLLCILSDTEQRKPVEMEQKEQYGIKILMVYFRRFSSSFSLLNRFMNAVRYMKAALAGLKRIEQTLGRHDVTHTYIMLRPALLAYWLKLTKGIPYVISEQWSGYASGKYMERGGVVRSASRWLFQRAEAATAVSQFLKDKMIACGLNNHRFEVVHNVVEALPRGVSPLQQNSNIKVLIVADLVDEIKNISGVIKAMPYVVKERKDTELHIVGHGRDEVSLKKLASSLGLLDSHVFFHGVKTNEEVFQYLYACDFLVVNSFYETFSLICAEALSCGKPVIATRCGGPEEFITPQTGMLIDTANQEQLEQTMLEMLNTYGRYDAVTLAKYATDRFSAQEAGRRFLSLYQHCLY